MRGLPLLAVCLAPALSGCASLGFARNVTLTSVVPSLAGTPNSIVASGDFEFVSVQGTGQIFTYNVSSGVQVLAAAPYATPCADPSGMVVASISGAPVLAAACYDTGSLLTLAIHPDGSLSGLGSVGGLGVPYPGVALDGTNVLIPIYGRSLAANGGVAKVSIAHPAAPVVTGTATLASPAPGAFANPGFLTVAGGNLYVAAGSESAPQTLTSSIQVVDEATMNLLGSPLIVQHSPQQIAVAGNLAYATIYDEQQLLAIDVSDPADLRIVQTLSLANSQPACHPLSAMLDGASLYVGCYAEGAIEQFSVANPAALQLVATVSGVADPQQLILAGTSILTPASVPAGAVYDVALGLF